jgi:hypothetical protein
MNRRQEARDPDTRIRISARRTAGGDITMGNDIDIDLDHLDDEDVDVPVRRRGRGRPSNAERER